jgi:coenzyme F420-reducing hydrogenase alpha subunit
MSDSRTIRVDALARVEGEGAINIKMKGDRVTDVKLRIFEPPRMFEAFLRWRHFTEVPDIVARICGICPIAYQMSSVHALEAIVGAKISPAVRELRRLFYCGEWIESHALHIYMLHAPDFLGYEDVIAMAKDHGEAVQRALRLKKIGNQVMIELGGREIHPISACVGGFYKVPTKQQLNALIPDLEWALETSLETVRFTSTLEFPDFEQDYEFVALRHPHEYPLNEGHVVSSSGLDIAPSDYEEHFVESHVKHSNALHSTLRGCGSYLVGPLARFNLCYDMLPDEAKSAAKIIGLQPPVKNPFRSITVRAVELVFACVEALRIIRAYEPPAEPRIELTPRAGVGHAVTEAPRGILYHRYSLDDSGLVLSAKIVPPTSQNQKRIEDDLRAYAPRLGGRSLADATWKCEQAVRNYDPCISCATHFLKLERE